jgi:hypothetical protein
MDRRSYPMLSIPVLVTADQYWRREPAPLPMLTAELTPLVVAESLTPMAEAESLAQLVAGELLSPLTPAEPLAESVLAEPQLAESVLVEPQLAGSVLVEQQPVTPTPDQRRRRLRLPIRRLPR